jgi:hypothetical protein
VPRERIHYFERQLLSAEDLAQEQLYFREKARRHNRLLHGWGVAFGLEVTPGTAQLEVVVSPGYAIDARGEEIVVDSKVTVDLCRAVDDDDTVLPCDSDDEEPRAVVERSPGQGLYVAVRYMECYSRPVPLPGDGSEEGTAYSRIREGFRIAALTELPDASLEPWVILADVTIGSRREIARIDPVTHRRRVRRDG